MPRTEAGGELHFYIVGLTAGLPQQTEVLQAADQLILAIEAEAVAAERERIVREVEGLPDHSVEGYEWECDAAEDYKAGAGFCERDSGRLCPHHGRDDAAISRKAVLAIVRGEQP